VSASLFVTTTCAITVVSFSVPGLKTNGIGSIVLSKAYPLVSTPKSHSARTHHTRSNSSLSSCSLFNHNHLTSSVYYDVLENPAIDSQSDVVRISVVNRPGVLCVFLDPYHRNSWQVGCLAKHSDLPLKHHTTSPELRMLYSPLQLR
jgi:hypothetical protein